ncbi:apolipoprotein N-acyltransferase [Labrenzia sp. R5_0]|jgi:apolipoprotein N-acyltransferase|uniref:apolipoprotein N-acyltransferase n=1 Tax=Labrenzia sp. R5_0 TaxID=2821108 RepID=UPI001ADC5BAE|nr:apolipoprotein N-acyltransferase [Labrenzia sp. R5_0]MBO9460757.1 apolipoprotein N-acyltransferase [Labrenzia sp. R5_0]
MQWLSHRLSALPNTFLLAWGWQRRLLCVACGALTAFALPPYDFTFVLLVTFPCLVWMLDGAVDPAPGKRVQRFRTGFVLGWLFGFGYFLSGLWWIGAAFLVEAERFAWLMPFAVLAMPVGLALFTGLGVGLAAIFWSDQFRRILVLAAGLTLTDWLRGHVLTGFPWNAFGYGVSGSLSVSQAASLVGLYGLTFFVVAVFSTPAVLADARPFRQRATAVVVAAVALAAVAGYGAVRLWQTALPVADLDIRIVQPSIDQKDKWRPELRDEIFQTFLDMTEAPLGGAARVGQPRMVVWPESAVPFLLTQEPGALFRIGQSLGDKTELVTGAIRAEPGMRGADYFNSVFVIGTEGTVQGIYDKVRLVPFGEYVPFKPLLESLGISNLAGPMDGFEAGYQPRVLTTSESFSFLPMICYEAIFPGSLDGVSRRPDFLLNVTNDAWFGRTPGPYQHLAQARLRAIETGLPLIRAANTGISAVIDAKGQVVAKLAIFEKGLIDSKLPQRLDNTLYGIFGDLPVLVISFLIVVFAGVYQYNRDSRVN